MVEFFLNGNINSVLLTVIGLSKNFRVLSWCEDTGFLFSKDSKMVKIFTSHSYDGDKLTIGTITVFPRSVVKKIEVLK